MSLHKQRLIIATVIVLSATLIAVLKISLMPFTTALGVLTLLMILVRVCLHVYVNRLERKIEMLRQDLSEE